jgi:hypothetical protein
MKKITLSVAALTIAMMSYGQSTQCKELTKDSTQCKNKTTQVLCHLHNPNYKSKSDTKAIVCSGTTKSGRNCKNKTKNTSGFCHLHGTK